VLEVQTLDVSFGTIIHGYATRIKRKAAFLFSQNASLASLTQMKNLLEKRVIDFK
jgi:hypothetical protein